MWGLPAINFDRNFARRKQTPQKRGTICKPRADDRLHVSKFQNFTLYTGIRPLDSQIIEASVSKDRKIHLVGKFPSHSGLI